MVVLAVFALIQILRPQANLENSLDLEWNHFKHTFKKSYTREEEMKRRAIWEDNWMDISLHNHAADLGRHTFRMGINEYSDITLEELIGKLEDFVYNPNVTDDDLFNALMEEWTPPEVWYPPSNVDVPDNLDWRDAGWVTPIKNQGRCGSCWAFATVGALEGQQKNKTGKLVALSEQNLVDCSIQNAGCNGGDQNLAFNYVRKNKGISTEVSYPYTATNGTCRFNETVIGSTCSSHMTVALANEEFLKKAVALVGPVAIAMDALHNSFLQYKSGIYDEAECRPGIFSHAMLVIGYGTENGKDYWLVKNSFGETWGMDGYIKMSRNKNNQCGIATGASFPII